ncbi:MAG: winged helix-turn-helix domain-containing protein [Nanoarchaeota archaeon]
MDGIDVVGGDLDSAVAVASSGINGIPPAETDLEGLLGNEDTIPLDPSRREVYVNHDGELKTVDLTPTEFSLLEYLMRNAGRAVPYDEISREVFGHEEHNKGLQKNIKDHVGNLRKKLRDNPHNPIYIESIGAVGYKFIGTHKHAVDDIPLGSEKSLLLYPLSRQIYVNDNGKPREVHLTRREFSLLEYLMRNAGRAVPYDEISAKVLGHEEHNKGLQKNIKDHVGNLRKKLGDNPYNPIYIENIKDVGYKFIGTHKHAVDDMPLGSEKSLLLYPLSREFYVNDNGEQREVYLTTTEFNLLKYLMRNAGKVVSHKEIFTKVLGHDEHDKDLQKNIRYHVELLRKKIGDNSHNPIHIGSIIGVGYIFIGAQNNR